MVDLTLSAFFEGPVNELECVLFEIPYIVVFILHKRKCWANRQGIFLVFIEILHLHDERSR